jgi:hypothetical protein
VTYIISTGITPYDGEFKLEAIPENCFEGMKTKLKEKQTKMNPDNTKSYAENSPLKVLNG